MTPEHDPITPFEAATRFTGTVLLVAVGYLHLLDISHKVDEGVWYMAFLFAGLIVAAIALAVALVRCSPQTVRLAWSGAALLAAGALFGYFVSRMVPLPGMADHRGDWVSLYGVLAAFVEIGLIGVSAYAMRTLTIRGVAHTPPAAFRIPTPSSVAVSALLALALLPQQAFGHGGVDDEATAAPVDPKGGAKGKGTDAGESATTAGGEAPAAHGDPFLGTAELGFGLAACVGFVLWAGRSLGQAVDRTALEA